MRHLLALLLALPAFGQITCPSSHCVVTSGGTLSLTNPGGSTTWSVSGSGASVSPSTGATTTLTMASGAVAQHIQGGCPVEPNDSIYNTVASNWPVSAHSAAIIAGTQQYGFAPLVFQPLGGISIADSTTPITAFKAYYDNQTYNVPYPSGANLRKESGNQDFAFGWKAASNPQGNPDQHTMIVRRSDCSFYSTYINYSPEAVSICHDGTTAGCNVQGVGIFSTWPANPYLLDAGDTTDLAGTPQAPMVWTLEEIKKDKIRHGVRGTTCAGCFTSGAPSPGVAWLWPAKTANNGCYQGTPVCPTAPTFDGTGTSTNYPMMGTAWHIKASFASGTGVCGTDTATPTVACTISGTGGICTTGTTLQNAYCVTMLTAKINYPTWLTDIGSINADTPSMDLTTDPDVWAAVQMIQNRHISSTNYEVLDLNAGGAMQDAVSYRVTPNGTAGYSGTFGGVTYSGATQSSTTPVNSVTVSTSGGLKQAVAVQPVTIGTNLPFQIQAIMSGATITVPLWVNPSTLSQSVTLSITGAGCGTASGATITAATTSSIVTGCAIHGVAAADSAAVIDIYYSIYPTDSGTLRIDSGETSTTTDGNGKTWQPDSVPYGSSDGNSPVTSTAAHWGTGTYINQFAKATYSLMTDLTYTVIGAASTNYKLHALYGMPDGFASYPAGTWPGSAHNWFLQTWSPINIELNGRIVAHAFDWGYGAGFAYNQGVDVFLPVTTDASGMVSFSTQLLVPDVPYTGSGPFAVTTTYTGPNLAPADNLKYLLVSGFELIPDATPAHWAIDTASQTSIAAGTSLQPFYVVDWHTGDSDVTTPTWSVVSGPSGVTINASTGVLSLASGTYLSGQPIIVKAAGASHSATATIKTVAPNWVYN